MNSIFQHAKRLVGILVMVVCASPSAAAQSSPKKEFRGAWIATVINLDWPSTPGLPSGTQQAELITLLNSLKDAGINAVIFQVRSESDAMYNSPIDPWSYWLTGQQGQPPSPYYDPLEFAVKEAHARGMELHAWFNPYRAIRNISGTYPPDTTKHVTGLHPDWILTFPAANIKIVNPGLPQVRDYLASVVADIVRRYDVDGVHADDYFYPYPDGAFPGITSEDTATFSQYPFGFSNIKEWRRNNVNLLLQQIYDSLQVIKPHVKFGMSPFGIWRPGNPPGIFGLDAYDQIYCDAVAWLQGQYIDYLAPQLYWSFGGSQNYGSLQPWWADSVSAHGRHLYTGNAVYRIGLPTFGPASQMKDQILFNRANAKVQGSIQFRANNIRDNIGGWKDMMKADVFRLPAVVPVMPWKEMVPPNAPANLRVDSSGSLFVLRWDPPAPATDSDTASRYLVYRFTGTDTTGREESRNLNSLEGGLSTVPSGRVDSTNVQYYFAVSALDKNNNESPLSGLVSLSAPVAPPTLVSPIDGGLFARTGSLVWQRPLRALSFLVHVSLTAGFSADSLVATIPISDTLAQLPGLVPQQKYYWRAAAGGQAGTSGYSPVFSFTTGWPFPPVPLSPVSANNVSLTPTLTWSRGLGTSFEVRILDTGTGAEVVHTTVSDTFYTSQVTLGVNKIYGWQAIAANQYGSSDWSIEARFRTTTSTFAETTGEVPLTFALSQNYPNPFNPTTTMRFSVTEAGPTTLRIYDILGREVATPVNENLPPGTYNVRFDASGLPSGTYISVLTAEGKRKTVKMLLMK